MAQGMTGRVKGRCRQVEAGAQIGGHTVLMA
jgi:hypothetical protein